VSVCVGREVCVGRQGRGNDVGSEGGNRIRWRVCVRGTLEGRYEAGTPGRDEAAGGVPPDCFLPLPIPCLVPMPVCPHAPTTH
jgi:hypothetical protein